MIKVRTTMKMQLTILFAIVVFSVGGATASEVTGLTSFTSGTPAKASEVNDNFSAVKTAVDDNAADITTNASDVATNAAKLSLGGSSVTVLANGETIGLLLDTSDVDGHCATGYVTRSNTGYLFYVIAHTADNLLDCSDEFSIREEEGHLSSAASMVFSSLGCQGDAYLAGPAGFSTFGKYVPTGTANGSFGDSDVESVLIREGLVIRNMDRSATVQNYYVPKGSQEAPIVFSSVISPLGSTCLDAGPLPFPTNATKLLPNDPAITGVPDTPFALPITLGP
jgi:hypothetical protein